LAPELLQPVEKELPAVFDPVEVHGYFLQKPAVMLRRQSCALECVGSVRRRTDRTPYVGQPGAMDWIAASAEWRRFKHAVRAEWKNLTSAQLDVVSGVR